MRWVLTTEDGKRREFQTAEEVLEFFRTAETAELWRITLIGVRP